MEKAKYDRAFQGALYTAPTALHTCQEIASLNKDDGGRKAAEDAFNGMARFLDPDLAPAIRDVTDRM